MSDGRRIISGIHSTEEDRKRCLNEEQWKQWKQLERKISECVGPKIDITHNGQQHYIIGTKDLQNNYNPWGHTEGTIGSTIDYCVQLGVFTKRQIEILAGTKISKVNSHIRSMEMQEVYFVQYDDSKNVSFRV